MDNATSLLEPLAGMNSLRSPFEETMTNSNQSATTESWTEEHVATLAAERRRNP